MTYAQEKLLALMIEIDSICRKHNIDYTLAGGSLIGAVRHRGFIPWDDDMDIYMTQKNWYKFVDAVNEYGLPENRVLEAPELNREYSNMFGRYADTTTTAIHKSQIGHHDAAGQVIDIFVFDPIEDSQEAFDAYLKNIMLYSDLMNYTIGYETRFDDISPWVYPKYLNKCKLHGKDSVMKELEKNFKLYDEEKCSKYIMRWGGNTFVLDKEVFEGYEYVQVENTELEIIKNFNLYLTWQYGDEWELIPPHDEQQGHETVASDIVGYQVVRDDYMPFINGKKLEKAYKRRKFKHLLAGKSKHEYQDRVQRLKQVKTKLELEKRIEAADEDVFEMLAKEEYAKLGRIFNDFINDQMNVEMVGRVDNFTYVYRYYHPMLIDIEDKYWALILDLLMGTNRISKAYRLINIYEKAKGNDNEHLENIRLDILKTRAVVNYFYRGELKECISLANERLIDNPKNYRCMKIKLRVLLKHHELSSDYDTEVYDMLSYLKNTFPEDGEVAKYFGDYYFETDIDKAVDYYKFAYSHTNNGYILLELRVIFQGIGMEPPELMEGV